jgi:peptidyl-prolyl cis-trans isomerase A (cyclophilin A)
MMRLLAASMILQTAFALPDQFCVQLDTSLALAPIVLAVNSSLAPIGVQRFHALIQDKFYDDIAVFRVVPNFVMQFGISGMPDMNTKWNETILDDPVLQSNSQGWVSYATAGPNTRTTQLFINFVDNPQLDARGFAPFAKVISGLDTALSVINPTPGNRNGIDQQAYTTQGNKWMRETYPNVTFITKTTVIDC